MNDVGLMFLGVPVGALSVAIGLRLGFLPAAISWAAMVLGMAYLVEAIK